MAAADDILVLNRAPTQADRARAAPAPGRVKVDGRSLADLLAFAANYGALINYYDLDDHVHGDWAAFFRNDPSISLALRASLDLADIQAELDRLLEELGEATSFEARMERLRAAIPAIVRLVRILTDGGTGDIEGALASLATAERRDLLAAPARRLALHIGGNSLEYGLRHDRDDWFPQLLEYLEALVTALVTALDQERVAALAALEASFDNPAHPPQSALYDTFAVLFRHAQDSINSFPARLLHFYQAEVLRQTSRAGTPDTVCLTFTPAKGYAHAELPHGTRFLAGTDGNGQSIAYALDSALMVDAASVAALRTLTVTYERLGRDGKPIPAQVLSGIVALADKAPQIAKPFPLFGASAKGTSGALKTVEATLGFAVASPTLMLTGGSRTVTLGLTIAPASMAAMAKTLEALGAAGGGDPLVTLLEAAFKLRYSSAGGWVDIASYDVTRPVADKPLFDLSFSLGPDADPFLPLSAVPAAKGAVPPAKGSAVPDVDMPTLLADLRQDPVKLGTGCAQAMVYPYALLSSLELSDLSIEVGVAGLAGLEASSSAGPVNTSQPFLVFGSPPVQDSSLDISSPELFAKRLDSLEIDIEWYGLPVTAGGFRGYYKAYVVDVNGKPVAPGSQFSNESFKVALDVRNPGWWSIADSSYDLFQTKPWDSPPCPPAGRAYDSPPWPCDSPPCPEEVLEPETRLTAPVRPGEPPTYYDAATSAVRLRLTEPDTAFGNVLYAANVMAASVRLTAAASACAQQCGHPGESGGHHGYIGPVIAANAGAADSALADSVKAAVQRTVADLDGAALQAIEDAIAASGAEPETKAALRSDLSAALARPKRPSLLRRLVRWLWPPKPDYGTVHANLAEWLASHSASLGPEASDLLDKARSMLEAGSEVLTVEAAAPGRTAAISRPVTAARLREVQSRLADGPANDTKACIDACMRGTDLLGFPNQPWLPMAARISVDYKAATSLPAAPGLATGPTPPADLYRLLPFEGVEKVAWPVGQTVKLLAPIEAQGALYIGLSDPAEALTLLFRLAPPSGGWPIHTPRVDWAQGHGATDWKTLTPLRDGTHDLHNSGIVSLSLYESASADGVTWLRVSAPADATAFPLLASLATNAAMASWVGPGGGADLGTPLPAGTITKPASPLPAIGSIDQPLPSEGGSPAETGAAFDIWLPERLRHKDRAIQDWDYSHLVLAAFPSLWQVAVVPATEQHHGPAPGNVWVIPIPGRETPDIADPTIPSSDSTMLRGIADYLRSRVSPFIQLTVANPPYRRIMVDADLLFTDADSVPANVERLNAELIEFLSPWPSVKLPPRPDDYYTRKEVARFIRHRPYVRAILSLSLVPEVGHGTFGWHYLTSALAHSLRGKLQPDSDPTPAAYLSLPQTAAPANERVG